MSTHISPLFFVPLGGSGEIGMNLNLYSYDNRWIMVDCGMMIAKGEDESTEHIYVPDPSFLRGKKLIAMILTHAHEDHIGAIVDLWPQLRCPLYTTPFTAAVIRKRLEEAGLVEAVKLNVCAPGSRIRLDPFSIEFIPITHSTVESQSILIKSPAGSILHTGDWKLDPEPLIGPKTAIARFKSLGNENILAVVGDSTNAPIQGHSGSENLVKKELSKLIPKEKRRVICACFSSNIARIATFIEIAKKTDRMVAFVGRSLKRMMSAAQETGYLPMDLPIISPLEAMRLPRNKVLLICTGSQAESKAALSKIAYDQHPEVSLSPEDTVFFSSKIIPGNENDIERLHLRLKQKGLKVITEIDEDIHVSGHPCQDELKQMYQWVKPQILIPVHGYPQHLEAHAQFGRELGISQVLEVRNGDVVSFKNRHAFIEDHVETGRLIRNEANHHRPSRDQINRGRRFEEQRRSFNAPQRQGYQGYSSRQQQANRSDQQVYGRYHSSGQEWDYRFEQPQKSSSSFSYQPNISTYQAGLSFDYAPNKPVPPSKRNQRHQPVGHLQSTQGHSQPYTNYPQQATPKTYPKNQSQQLSHPHQPMVQPNHRQQQQYAQQHQQQYAQQQYAQQQYAQQQYAQQQYAQQQYAQSNRQQHAQQQYTQPNRQQQQHSQQQYAHTQSNHHQQQQHVQQQHLNPSYPSRVDQQSQANHQQLTPQSRSQQAKAQQLHSQAQQQVPSQQPKHKSKKPQQVHQQSKSNPSNDQASPIVIPAKNQKPSKPQGSQSHQKLNTPAEPTALNHQKPALDTKDQAIVQPPVKQQRQPSKPKQKAIAQPQSTMPTNLNQEAHPSQKDPLASASKSDGTQPLLKRVIKLSRPMILNKNQSEDKP